jgi:hypothetical protein
MKIRGVLRPKRPANFVVTGLLVAFMLLLYVIVAWWRPWSPKRGLGLVFGILAALLFVFEMMYPWRRPNAWLLGTAQRWIQAHVYLGAIAFVAVLIHEGFPSLPHGTMGWLLFLLTLWATLSGILGVFLQKWIPAALSENLRVEALYERIPELIHDLRIEADKMMEGTSDVLNRFYQNDVRPLLVRVSPSWGFFLDLRGGRDRALEPFRRISQFLDKDEQAKVTDLMAIYIEKVELDAQYSMQRILRRWLVLHVPPAAILMVLMFVHILAWLIY